MMVMAKVVVVVLVMVAMVESGIGGGDRGEQAGREGGEWRRKRRTQRKRGVKLCFKMILCLKFDLEVVGKGDQCRGNYKEDDVIPAYTAVVAVVRINFLFNKKFAFATEIAGKRLGTRITVLGKLFKRCKYVNTKPTVNKLTT